ncbi:MAG: DUF433 domain-containing protein [Novosphingobium sp.]|uniref:DUF433 domain-containing protein n=1 Tax=Novosphingobium sp. TaxID=1874826 RepID=UPI0032BE042F
MERDNIIGAFSEEQASRISGVSIYQLRHWDKEGFFPAAFGTTQQHVPFGRLYSFRDLVSLQVLNNLRNDNKIALSHLREVSERLSHLGDQKWSSTTLYILGRRVVLENPATKHREDVVSGQRVFNIPLRIVIKNTKDRIKQLNNRTDTLGEFSKGKFVAHNEMVFSGTRIPVSLVIEFYQAGYATDKIIREFPDLTVADVEAAIKVFESREAA